MQATAYNVLVSQNGRTESYLRELRLFLEEICCNLCRFRHAADDGVAPHEIRITQESHLGTPDVFADIRVKVKDRPPYFIEVKYGYTPKQIVGSLTRKYGPGTNLGGASKIVVLIDRDMQASWQAISSEIQAKLQDGLQLEVWPEEKLISMVREVFGVDAGSISERYVLELRTALDQAKGQYAFEDTWASDELQQALIWHYGFWRLKQLRAGAEHSRNITPPGIYRNVVVVMADLCAFTSYVRDTRQDDVIRHCLTTFYAKARYEILNTGGMMYQFVGDEVIGLYGIPDQSEGYLECAYDCAKALVDIGNSVSHEWQRQIDRIQTQRGLHIGIALGDMQVVSLRPFGRAHLGGIGEVINLAARLLSHAGPSEIMVSNAYYQGLGHESQAGFSACAPIEAKNLGMIQAWKTSVVRDSEAGAVRTS